MLPKPEVVKDLSTRPVAALPCAMLTLGFFHDAIELSLRSHLLIPIVRGPVLEQGVQFAALLPGERVDLGFDLLHVGHAQKIRKMASPGNLKEQATALWYEQECRNRF